MKRKNTCQICGRPVKAKSGVIAHHGYKRPSNGWQTASCMGARHLPYEESCDVIPRAIESVTSFIERTKERLHTLVTSPPDILLVMVRKSYSYKAEEELPRPDGFNPDKILSARPNSYESGYMQLRYELQTSLKYAREDLAYMEDRLAKWVKVR